MRQLLIIPARSVSVVIKNPEFYELAIDGAEIEVELDDCKVIVRDKVFYFEFSETERRLMDLGGIAQAFNDHGKGIFEALSAPKGTKMFAPSSIRKSMPVGDEKEKAGLQW